MRQLRIASTTAMIIAAISAVTGCSQSTAQGDACREVECSNGGICRSADHEIWCECPAGYEASGLTCVPQVDGGFDADEEADACRGVECSNGGVCHSAAGHVWCECPSGFEAIGLECVPGVDSGIDADVVVSCDGVTCIDFATCEIEDGRAVCNCIPGYRYNGYGCGEVLVEDDFEASETWTDRWHVDNAEWFVSDGTLDAGASCTYWGPPPCEEGPAIIHRAEPFEFGDGAFTLEFSLWLDVNHASYVTNSLRAILQRGEDCVDYAIEDGDYRMTGLDAYLSLYLDSTAMSAHLAWGWNGLHHADYQISGPNDLNTMEWYQVRIESCEHFASIIVTSEVSGGTFWEATYGEIPAIEDPPAATEPLRLLFFAEGTHRVDNVLLTRGCSAR